MRIARPEAQAAIPHDYRRQTVALDETWGGDKQLDCLQDLELLDLGICEPPELLDDDRPRGGLNRPLLNDPLDRNQCQLGQQRLPGTARHQEWVQEL